VDRFDAQYQGSNGATLDLRWELTHHGGATASGVAMFAVAEDVTEQRAEVDRTLRHERLEAVGNLAAGLAHEIRNPLNGAQLHLAFLERALSGQDPEVEEALDVVGNEIKRLAQLVSEFLEFARPHPLQREPTSLVALCERVVAIAAADAVAQQVILNTDLPPSDVTVEVDPERIRQLLLNLVQNSIEALHGQGGGHVTLRARRRPRTVVLEVEDDGPGLASADAPIFDAFYSTKANGTGLGLAIAHRVAFDHDGTIDVQSCFGRTCFTIVLPFTPAETVKRKEP
jgi:signal transduction histidine kinase